MKIYQFVSNTIDFSFFLQFEKDDAEENIQTLAFQQDWQPFCVPLPSVNLELRPSDSGKRNYRFDVSTMTGGFIVFSETLTHALGSVLQPRGQFIPVSTASKRKPYIGYYPTNPIKGGLNLNRSEYSQYAKGKVIHKYVLNACNITDEWLFVIEDGDVVFVTEKFRSLVEEKGFQGFSWRHQVEVV